MGNLPYIGECASNLPPTRMASRLAACSIAGFAATPSMPPEPFGGGNWHRLDHSELVELLNALGAKPHLAPHSRSTARHV